MMIFLLSAHAADVCTSWSGDERVEISDIPVEESSGVAAARTGAERYYTHNDADGLAELYLFDFGGDYLGNQYVDGATNVDWEDLASGPCPATVDAEHCLWIGDIGDNEETRDGIVVYVVPESESQRVDAVSCPLRYPEGKRWNAEAMLVSPDGVVRIVTKEGDGEAHVFRLDEPACDGEAQTLVEEARIAVPEGVTGGAVSDDGTTFVLRGDTQAWAWSGCTRDWGDDPMTIDLSFINEEVGDTMGRNGEAVAFDKDGGLVFTAEGDFVAWRMPCAATEAVDCPDCGCSGNSAAFLIFLPLAWRRRQQ